MFCMMPLRSFECTNIVGVLRGGGDVRMATLIDLTPLWAVALPLAVLSRTISPPGWNSRAGLSLNFLSRTAHTTAMEQDSTRASRVARAAPRSASWGAPMGFLPEQFMGLFGNDPAVVATAARYARIVGWSYFFDSFVQVYIGVHRAMGDPNRGLIILGVSMASNTFLNWVFI